MDIPEEGPAEKAQLFEVSWPLLRSHRTKKTLEMSVQWEMEPHKKILSNCRRI